MRGPPTSSQARDDLEREHGHLDLDLLLLAVAADLERERVSRLLSPDRLDRGEELRDPLAADLQDDVPLLQPRLRRGAALQGRLDDDLLAFLVVAERHADEPAAIRISLA